MVWYQAVFYVIGGFVLLILGGDSLVRAAISIANRYKLPPALIGLTIVALGTSLPELVTSLMAALKGANEIAVANVVGSNIFNILAITGVSCLIVPNRVGESLKRLEWPFLMSMTVALFFLIQDRLFDRNEGLIFIFLLIGFLFVSFKTAKKEIFQQVQELQEISKSLWRDLLILSLGAASLMFGADVTLTGAVRLGEIFGLSQRVIGLTVVSIGTGLPELATSAVAAYRGRDDIALANVIGSIIMNTLLVLGMTAAIHPLPIEEATIQFDVYWLLGATLFVFPFLLGKKRKMGRLPAIHFVIAYCVYVFFLF